VRNLARLRNASLSLSSIGASFSQPDFWSVPHLLGTTIGSREKIEHSFDGYVQDAYKRNGIVFTCILVRQHTLSEARFQFQRITDGRPGELFGDQRSMALLENPWPNGTTGELISRMEQDASLAGNFYATVVGSGPDRFLRRLRPDWMTIVTEAPMRDDGSPGQPWDLGARVAGYLYRPPGDAAGAVLLTPDQVVHWSPIPDPVAQWRGMSWITAITREVESDTAATRHKHKFFENGATSNMVITYDPTITSEQVSTFANMFSNAHSGVDKAYKTVHLGGGADAKMVGADLKQLDFKVTQGAGESRIAAASLVGAVVAQFSEGMQGSSLNSGNFTQAMRRWADIGARPLWRSMAAALAKPGIVDVPANARLWYDDRDIPFLQQDAKDESEIRQTDANTIRSLTEAGYTPDSIKQFVNSGDASVLQHTGVFSVQLQPPGNGDPSASIRVPVGHVADLIATGWTPSNSVPQED
jgi:phage portal protein BeeE